MPFTRATPAGDACLFVLFLRPAVPAPAWLLFFVAPEALPRDLHLTRIIAKHSPCCWHQLDNVFRAAAPASR